MKNLPHTLKNTLLAAGAATLLAAPAASQVPAKLMPSVKAITSPSVSVSVVKKWPQAPLLNLAAPKITVYNAHYAPAAMNIPSYSVRDLRPADHQDILRAQEILHKTLAKPADNFYGFFKQMVYAHQNSRAVIKKMNQDYFHEVYALLQDAAYVTRHTGYASLAGYLRGHGGKMPSLGEGNLFASDLQTRRELAFYASEELNLVLQDILARPEAKREPTDKEWLTINVLSVMLPDQTRPVFYDLLLDKKYDQLQWVSLDPYFLQADTRRLADGTFTGAVPPAPTRAQRMQQRESALRSLSRQQQQLNSVLQHQRQEYAKNKIVYDILVNEGQEQSAQKTKAALDKSRRVYMQSEKRLKDVTENIRQINMELDFFRQNP